MEKPTMTVGEVADYLNCSCDWVYRNQNKVPGLLKIGGLVRFHRQTFLDGLKPSKPKEQGRAASDRHGLL